MVTCSLQAAFVLPMLAYIARCLPPLTMANKDEGPYAVVLVPTHELAKQIEEETLKFAAYLGINKVVAIVGGEDIECQRLRYQDGCEIMVATPALLQIGPFVPVPKGYLSRFWNRDKAAGTKALEAFVPGGRTGTKCPSR